MWSVWKSIYTFPKVIIIKKQNILIPFRQVKKYQILKKLKLQII